MTNGEEAKMMVKLDPEKASNPNERGGERKQRHEKERREPTSKEWMYTAEEAWR